MDFEKIVKQMCRQFGKLKDNIQNRRSNKERFYHAFINALGYVVLW